MVQLIYSHLKRQLLCCVAHAFISYTNTVSTADASPESSFLQPLPRLICPENTACHSDQVYEIYQAQGLRLEHALQRRKINDHELANQAAGNGVIEHLVAEDLDFASENGLAFGTTGERIKHVEEHKASECHGSIAGCNLPITAHLAIIGHEGTKHNDGGRL